MRDDERQDERAIGGQRWEDNGTDTQPQARTDTNIDTGTGTDTKTH